jgi:hypothetical protein
MDVAEDMLTTTGLQGRITTQDFEHGGRFPGEVDMQRRLGRYYYASGGIRNRVVLLLLVTLE